MQRSPRIFALALALTACSTSPRNAPRGAGGSAQVEFVNPKEFTDFTGSGPSGRADEPRMLADLERRRVELVGRADE